MALHFSRASPKPNATGRNEKARHVRLYHWITEREVWKTLSSDAKALLIAVWERYNGANNGEIGFAVRDAAAIDISKDRAARAFAQLAERGFLKVRRESSFSVKSRESRLWEITALPVGYAKATNDFVHWQSDKAFEGDRKRKTQSHQRDRQSHGRDCEPETETKLPLTVASVRLSPSEVAPSQSHQCDTYSYHGGEDNKPFEVPSSDDVARQGDRRSAPLTPSLSPCPLPSPTVQIMPQACPLPGGSTFHRENLSTQIDLESLIAVAGGTVGSATAPTDSLRSDLDGYLKNSARGETAKLAARLGLSRPQLANFRYGTYRLNPAAARALRAILDAEGVSS